MNGSFPGAWLSSFDTYIYIYSKVCGTLTHSLDQLIAPKKGETKCERKNEIECERNRVERALRRSSSDEEKQTYRIKKCELVFIRIYKLLIRFRVLPSKTEENGWNWCWRPIGITATSIPPHSNRISCANTWKIRQLVAFRLPTTLPPPPPLPPPSPQFFYCTE